MSKVGEQVLVDFYSRLQKSGDVDDKMVEGLKELLGSGKKPKADDLVAVFEQETEHEST